MVTYVYGYPGLWLPICMVTMFMGTYVYCDLCSWIPMLMVTYVHGYILPMFMVLPVYMVTYGISTLQGEYSWIMCYVETCIH